MRTNYLLIDLENVQPSHLPLVADGPFKVKVFLGSQQTKLGTQLVRDLHAMGPDAVEYITIDGNGRNALDFHVAYYIGRLAAQDPTAFFHIVSKDKGFDPLVKHLKSSNVFCQRSASIDEIRLVKLLNSKSLAQRTDGVVEALGAKREGRPTRMKTLTGTIKHLFAGRLTDDDAAAVVQELVRRKFIAVDGAKIAYP